MVSDYIVTALRKATNVEDVSLTIPEYGEQGDYSSNIAMVMFSSDRFPISDLQNRFKTARELAEAIVDKLSKDVELSQYISRIEVAGAGFINVG